MDLHIVLLSCLIIFFCDHLTVLFCRFLSTQQLPEIMLQLRKSVQHDGCDVNSYEDKVEPCGNLSDLAVHNGEDDEMTQIELGNLRVSNLGKCSNIECSTFSISVPLYIVIFFKKNIPLNYKYIVFIYDILNITDRNGTIDELYAYIKFKK